jgi:wobble nucleotide-excising tRNase
MGKNEERISKLEQAHTDLRDNVMKLDDKIEKIMTNHLPHIQDGINDIKVQMAKYIGGASAVLIAVELISKFYK